MLRDVRKVAPLYGYEATTPKPAAEVVLGSQKLDPVLAAWQFGLGRSVAWTSDASGLWTKDWLRVPGANRFWSNLVSWVLPATGSGRLFITTSSSAGQGRISVNTPSTLGANPNVTARVLDPALSATTLQLQPSTPNQYGGSFQTSAQGAYFVTVEARGAGHADVGQVGMEVPYSPEYRTVGVNMAFLQALAADGGGSLITRPQDAWLDNLSPVLAQESLTAWLLLLALLLLPLDIGVRRLVLTRSELSALLARLPFRGRASSRDEPVVASLGALRARRAQRVPIAPQAMRDGRAAISLPRNPGRSRNRVPPPSAPSPSPSEESIANKLLAAKRNKRGQ
jgi:hypothetical protein